METYCIRLMVLIYLWGKVEMGTLYAQGVDPSTVCQFTGLKDEKGNEIWEGDLVNERYDIASIDNLYEVVYIEEEGNFAFKDIDDADNCQPLLIL